MSQGEDGRQRVRPARSGMTARDLAAESRTIPLRNETLDHCASRLPVPKYGRGSPPGVVHLGVGGFHRAHQAMYHDRLLGEEGARDWMICGVGVLPDDLQMKEALDAQG